MDNLIRRGIAASNAGDTEQGRNLFQQAVDDDPQDQMALLWLAAYTADVVEQQQYLLRVAAIDRTTPAGRMALVELGPATPAWLRNNNAEGDEGDSDSDLTGIIARPSVSEQDALPLPSFSTRTTENTRIHEPDSQRIPTTSHVYRNTPVMWVGMMSFVGLFVIVIACMIGVIAVITLRTVQIPQTFGAEQQVFANTVALDTVPASLPVTELVSFRDEQIGVEGLRPHNWQFYPLTEDTGASEAVTTTVMALQTQFSSSPGAPDGFIIHRYSREELRGVDIAGFAPQALSWEMRSLVERNGTLQVLEQKTAMDGQTTLLISFVGMVYADETLSERVPLQLTAYGQAMPTANGVIIGFAVLPTAQFDDSEELIREMVASLGVLPAP